MTLPNAVHALYQQVSTQQMSLYKLVLNVLDVSALHNVHDLSPNGSLNVVDVSCLGSVHTLDLEDCPNIKDLSALVSVLSFYGVFWLLVLDLLMLLNLRWLNLTL